MRIIAIISIFALTSCGGSIPKSPVTAATQELGVLEYGDTPLVDLHIIEIKSTGERFLVASRAEAGVCITSIQPRPQAK